jgi:hypothetical protein
VPDTGSPRSSIPNGNPWSGRSLVSSQEGYMATITTLHRQLLLLKYQTSIGRSEYPTLLSLGEEIFRRHDLKGVVKDYCYKIGLQWEYMIDIWDEEEVHQNARTYDEVIFNRRGQPIGRITDEEKAREEAKRKAIEETIGEVISPFISIHSVSTEEEEALIDKKRREKKRSLRRRMMLPRRSESLKQRRPRLK